MVYIYGAAAVICIFSAFIGNDGERLGWVAASILAVNLFIKDFGVL